MLEWQRDVPLIQRRLVPDGHDGSPLLGWDNKPANMCVGDLLMIDKVACSISKRRVLCALAHVALLAVADFQVAILRVLQQAYRLEVSLSLDVT